MSRKKLLSVILAVLFLTSFSTITYACACCAERGTYSILTGRVASYQIDLLREMKFGKAANLYTTPASFDDIKGIKDVIKEFEKTTEGEFDIVGAFTGSKWTLNFMTEGEQTGSLFLPRPATFTSRRIHIPDNTSNAPDVSLYKEWTFTGGVSKGSGFFRNGIVVPATKYTLIFQGHGNNCDNAEDFKNWRLQISGPKAEYAFFGKMMAAN